MFADDLPDEASRRDSQSFYDELLDMETADLNMLQIGDYPKWARRVLNAERCRRKENGGSADRPSKKVKNRIISLGIGSSDSSNNPSFRRSRKPAEIEEIDGAYLHESIATEASYDLAYDDSLEDSMKFVRYGERSVVGNFTCNYCRPGNPRGWVSGVISTELWLYTRSPSRYRTLIHSQKCKRCNHYAEPEVDFDNYVRKVVSAFDLWKGLRVAEEPEYRKPTAPHDSERCHGCEIGVCQKGKQGNEYEREW
ncbi:hypothetical protein BGX26_006354 [Mortierella sp. AD094]|nr:hypothetical protein BGX26_006354 [Mortierella sp. AD094]